MQIIKNYFPVLLSCILFISCSREEVDLIIHNATIYTVNDQFTTAEALAVRNDSIIEIGPEHQIMNKYHADEVIDAKSMYVYPGFIDAHCHFYGYALNTLQANLVGSRSWKEVLERLDNFYDKDDEWILARGWDQSNWENNSFPHKSSLAKYGDRPVFLKRIDGHAIIVNQKLLDMAGITSETIIDGGIIAKDSLGEPSGVLIDNAVNYVERLLPELSAESKEKALLNAEQICLKNGLTTVDDAGLNLDAIQFIDQLQLDGKLKIHVYAMANPTEKNFNYFFEKGFLEHHKLKVRSFKIYADGAMGSRGAMLLKPYSDVDHKHLGLLINSPAYFDEIAKKIYDAGFQLNTHAIGDSANRLILNSYGKVLKDVNDRRWRVEHAQIINPSDLKKFREFTIIPSVQPTHATSDMDWIEDRIGKERVNHAYSYQQLLEQNGVIALGTDFPVEDVSPIKTFYAAVTRKDTSSTNSEPFQGHNAISRQSALKGMTIWAALSNFEENEKGSIEVGKKAHFTILDRDLINAKEEDLLKTKVIYTIIDGEIVYKSTR